MPQNEIGVIDEGPRRAPLLLLAHGAGAGMDSAFMQSLASQLVAEKIRVVRFEFPYMQQQRQTGKRRPPNSAKLLKQHWVDRIEQFASTSRQRSRCFIGGKSMGGRIASLVADETGVAGLIGYGFPFQAPKKPNPERIRHLRDLKTPTLILQGTRDPFGTPEDVANFSLSSQIRIDWLEDGNHDFTPRKSSGRTFAQNLQQAVAESVAFIQTLCAKT